MRAEIVGLAFCWLTATQLHGHEPQDVVIENEVLSVRISPEGAELLSPRASHDFQESPEALEKKGYLMRLNPGESKTYRFTITVHRSR